VATDKIVIVYGKADVRNGRVSVVADSAQDYVEGAKVVEDTSSVAYRYRNGTAEPSRPVVREQSAARSTSPSPARHGPMPSSPSDAEDEDASYSGEDNPFVSDEPEWLADEQGSATAEAPQDRGAEEQKGKGAEEAKPRPTVQTAQPASNLAPQVSPSAPPAHPPVAASSRGKGGGSTALTGSPSSPEIPHTRVEALQLPGTSTPPPTSAPTAARSRVIRVTFRRSQSLDADRRRLAELVELLSKYDGDDRFEIVVEANSHARYQLNFPNNRTRICRELQAELTQRLGAGRWKVEE